ncbi:TAF9-like protein, partial [Mya arenaria]
MAAPTKSSPKDAQVMAAILKDMGVTEYEPRLINQMLEFTYRYVTDVLDDAKVYSGHANKKAVDTEDVQLALLLEIARHKNNQSLPLIKPYSGPRLPPDRYCLSAPNYKLVSRKKLHRIQIGLPVNQLPGGHRISLTPVQQ